IYVADQNNHRIQKLDRDGHFLTHWGTAGTRPGQFNPPRAPTGIAIDGDRTPYLVDTFGYRGQLFRDTGVYGGEFGSRGTTDGLFQFPVNIAVSSDFAIYVADVTGHKIDKFVAKHTPVVASTWGRLKNRYR